MLEAHETQVAAVRQALIEGEDSGRADDSLDAVKEALGNAGHS